MKKLLFFFCLFFCVFIVSVVGIAFAEQQTPIIVGDLDLDGKITDWDAILLTRKVNDFQIDLINDKIADINGDTAINDDDVELFDKYLANWSVDTKIGAPLIFEITYLNTYGANNQNPTSLYYGNIETPLSEISRENYRFEGWYVGNTKYTSIPENQNDNLVLTAKWTPIAYSISYENIKGAQNPNAKTYTVESDTIVLTDLSMDGYTFSGWYNGSKKVTKIETGSTGNINLTAKWTPITYSATFVCDGSVVATRYFTIEDSAIGNIPAVPSKVGYRGEWQDYDIVADDITIYANYSLETYKIIYSNLKGAENHNPATYTAITETFSLANIYCDGYIFEGWYQGNTKITKIEKGTCGQKTLTAKWTPIEYSINYSDTKDAPNANPLTYTIESETIYLKDITADYYIFDGWWLNGTEVYSIPAGSIGNIDLAAHWTPISYSVSYLNTKGASNANPIQYTIEDQIILQELSVDGYTFEGWFIGEEQIEKIAVGTYGSKVISARWSPTTYSITYRNTKGAENLNVLQYNIEQGTIFLKDLSAPGYIFDGWTLNGEKIDRITGGSFGDIVLQAQWTPISYSLSYSNTKGASNANPTTYSIEDSIVLKDITATGYSFDGWYIDGEKVTKINAGSYENKTLTAKWTPIAYSITYTNTYDAPNSNAQSYSIESETIVFDAITRDGYEFDGWKLNGEFVTEIKSGSNGDITLTACWTPITYPISYITPYNSEIGRNIKITHTNPANYTVEDEIVLSDPRLPVGYVFDGWYLGSEKISKIPAGTTGSKSLSVKWTYTGKYIKSAEDFASIIYDPTGVYDLAANIYIRSTICDSTLPFRGVFNGNGYSIFSQQPFGEIAASATVMNLQVKENGANPTRGYALADVNRGLVDNCFASYGLIRDNYGTIKNSRAVSISGKPIASLSRSTYGGGLVGYNDSDAEIISCYVVSNCKTVYSDGIYTVGGIAGWSSGLISDCYFDGSIHVTAVNPCAGGIIGGANSNSITQNCYAIGSVSTSLVEISSGPYAGTYGTARSGGIIGSNEYACTIKNCFSSMTRVHYGIAMYVKDGANCYFSSGKLPEYNTASKKCFLTDANNLKSPYFVRTELKWDENIWLLYSGETPTLKRGV